VEHYPLANGQLVANKDRLLNSQITKSGTGDISDWACSVSAIVLARSLGGG
jgi:hypothetical protein